MTRFRSICSTLALAAAVTTIAHGYALSGHKWGVFQVPYYINPANADGVSSSAAISAIQNAAAAWSMQSNANVLFYYMGQTSGTSAVSNGKNEVFFRQATSGSIAQTFRWWNASTNQLIDADVVFYDSSWKFFGGMSGCSNGFYIQEIATHELGHALGLDHSSVSTATMYPGSPYCNTSKASLDADDIAGIEKLYPASSGSGSTTTNSAPSVTVSSPATNSSFLSSTRVTFSGTATDQQDGTLTSRIVWRSSLLGQIGIGGSLSALLPVGTNTITASVTDSGGMTTTKQVVVTVTSSTTTTTAKLSLSASGSKVKGLEQAALFWKNATSATVDIFRNNSKIATVSNAGSMTDHINARGSGSYTYKVCNTGTTTCSNTASVVF
jgi:hypothetical protein